MAQKIFVVVLDWGIGHATRMIPIIKDLVDLNQKVLIGSAGSGLILLQESFPDLPFVKLPAYNIRYPSTNMVWNIAIQLPKIAWTILKEYLLTQKIIQQQEIKILISDNRFGCFSKKCHSVFLTHQLYLKMPFKWLEAPANFFNSFFIRRFDNCWVPDWATFPNLSGALSHPKPNEKTFYIGPLSRLACQIPTKEKVNIAAILSGPEPQKSKLKERLIESLKKMGVKATLILGEPESDRTAFQIGNLKVIPFLNSAGICQVIASSDLVICRSGYSSLMDLVHLNKQALIIPTPGQTEQIYLAEWCQENHLFLSQTQDNLDIETALQQIQDFHPSNLNLRTSKTVRIEIIKRLLEKTMNS